MSVEISDDKILKAIKQVAPFPKFRENQEDVILKIAKAFLSGTKYVILEAPTGAGKSFIAYTATRAVQVLNGDDNTPSEKGPYTLAAVKTRSLQKQYEESLDLPLIWSGTNYECALFPDDETQHWGSGTCLQRKCPAYEQCEYVYNYTNFMNANVGITNYAYYMNASNITSEIAVIDECHNLEEALCSWMTVELSTKFLFFYLTQLLTENIISAPDFEIIRRVSLEIIDMDDEKEGWLDTLRDMAESLYVLIVAVYACVDKRIKDIRSTTFNPQTLPMEKRQQLTRYGRVSKYFKNFAQKLNMLAKLETDWVIASRKDEQDNQKTTHHSVSIKPLQVNEVSQNKFFNRSNHFLLMSATVCNHELMMKYLGIPSEGCEYIQMPSTFPVENRPVIAINDIGKFSYAKREFQLPMFTKYLDIILENQFKGVRGVIHSASYDNAAYIKEHSQCVDRMRFPNSDELTEIVSLLKEREDTIVVSPSVVEGLDLKEDLCRFSIFYKVPWSSLGDKWVKTKSADSDWYSRDAVVKIIQGSGRGTRSKTDSSVTLVMDAHFLRLYYRYAHFFPEWFLEAVEIVSVTK